MAGEQFVAGHLLTRQGKRFKRNLFTDLAVLHPVACFQSPDKEFRSFMQTDCFFPLVRVQEPEQLRRGNRFSVIGIELIPLYDKLPAVIEAEGLQIDGNGSTRHVFRPVWPLCFQIRNMRKRSLCFQGSDIGVVILDRLNGKQTAVFVFAHPLRPLGGKGNGLTGKRFAESGSLFLRNFYIVQLHRTAGVAE